MLAHHDSGGSDRTLLCSKSKSSLVALHHAMARRGHGRRRRRSFNLRRVRVAAENAIGALATLDVVGGNLTGTSTDPYRIMSVSFTYGLSDLGATSDDGQEFGLAHSDYSDAEIEECLEAVNINVGDKIAQERANRLVRTIGQFVGAPGTGAGLNWNDGKRVKTRLNWGMTIGDVLRVWVRNASGTVYTTGATIDVIGDMWVKDAA